MGKANTLKNAQSYKSIGNKRAHASQLTTHVSLQALYLENLSVS